MPSPLFPLELLTLPEPMTTEIAFDKRKVDHPPYEIHTLGDRVLRQTAKRIVKVDAEVRQIVENMLRTMYSADGIGLAAPQVAIAKQIIVVDIEPDDAANPPLILINPVIRKKSTDFTVSQEGCLSIPEVYLDVKRPEMIEVAFKDELGRPQAIRVVARDSARDGSSLRGAFCGSGGECATA
jgi:peptide deformylase